MLEEALPNLHLQQQSLSWSLTPDLHFTLREQDYYFEHVTKEAAALKINLNGCKAGAFYKIYIAQRNEFILHLAL